HHIRQVVYDVSDLMHLTALDEGVFSEPIINFVCGITKKEKCYDHDNEQETEQEAATTDTGRNFG
ncbi:MAG: hypothetical protein MN733_43180, partial [Nitrososphaera sp.]|nr:hypothetical protein [Nitrososphaera sp.]